MNGLTLLLTSFLIGAPVLLFWIVFIQLPGLAHAHYRAELWEIHDGLVEKILMGELSRTRTALQLLDDIEGLIQTSAHQTIPRVLLAWRAFGTDSSALADNPLASDEALLGSSIPPRDRVALLEATDRVRRSINRHLKRGSVVGWALWASVRFVDARTRQRRVVQIYSAEVAASRSASTLTEDGAPMGGRVRPGMVV